MKDFSINILAITFVLAVLLSLTIICCSENNFSIQYPNQKQSPFPGFFVEQGSDIDSSYISFQGIERSNDTLEIKATSWGIVEYGLILVEQKGEKLLLYKMMGECGTVLTKTWRKVTLTEWLSASETDTIWQIGFTNLRDTIMLAKTTTSN